MIPAEVSFPRGCRKPITPKPGAKRSAKDNDNLFPNVKVPKAKKPRKERTRKGPNDAGETTFHDNLHVSGTLAYNKIQEGMIILSCIKNVTVFSLELELPGLTFGKVPITNISDPLTSYLNKRLENQGDDTEFHLNTLFKTGQFVPAKVKKIEAGIAGVLLETTINPREIYEDKSHNSFKEGLLAWGCIQSRLDHGYEVSIGVKNCRVFLPFKNTEDDVSYDVGKTLWLVVQKCDTNTAAATNLHVSAKNEHIQQAKIEELDSLHDLIPGMQVELCTDKITSNGIQGKFLDDYFGYIDETQLRLPMQSVDNYNEGKLITAYVLYVEPTTKITHLTLRDLRRVPKAEFKKGDIQSVVALHKAHNGVYFKFNNGEKGFVTNKRLIKSLNQTASVNITDAVRLKFPSGSKHSCRILDYNYMERIYIATVEASILKEKIFTIRDVKIGEAVTVQIVQVKAEGLLVSLGNLKGFVPNLHLSNALFSQNVKNKYIQGMSVKARVLNVTDDGNIILTVKQSLVENDVCLADLNAASSGVPYPAVIVSTKSEGALVSFYGGVKGWIAAALLHDQFGASADPNKYFFRGQVINVWVINKSDDTLFVTVRQPNRNKSNLKVGWRMDAIVTKVETNQLLVKSADGHIKGIVPVNHLSSNLGLCGAMLNTFRVGDKICKLVCVKTDDFQPVFSRRENFELARTKYRIKQFDSLKVGDVLRCCYDSKSKAGVHVYALIDGYTELILIPNKKTVNYQPHQSIVTRISKINHDTRKICVNTDNAFDKNIKSVEGYISSQLKDLAYLELHGVQTDSKLCKYKRGERIQCTVVKVAIKGGCAVALPNGAQGLVAKSVCPANLTEGDHFEGVLLAHNFAKNYAEISLDESINQKINKTQVVEADSFDFTSGIADKLLVTDDYVIGVLRNNGQRKLVCIPIYLHENDRVGCLKYYEKRNFKVTVCGVVGQFVVAVHRKLYASLAKDRKKVVPTRKGKRAEKEEESEDESDENIVDDELETQVDVDSEVDEIIEHEQEEEEEAEETEIESAEEVVDVEMKNKSIRKCEGLLLPGVSSFFNQTSVANLDEESSSDDEEPDEAVHKKRKRLTNAERAELARIEEERISKIERELADNRLAPQSAEQFDRLLLANPNSSELWLKYIAFHISCTELEKARAVGKRALEAINMTLQDEKFNVWVALLHLENLYGSKESFNDMFENAVKFNDSLKIYLKVIEMLAEAGVWSDMEDKIRKVRNKHKQNPTMWLEIAQIYYKIKNFKEARNMKEAALKSIEDKKIQMSLILRFATMEFKIGEEDQGAAIFETILSSDPRKVNVWSMYVDQLVKKGRIEEARKILDRSVCQRLPVKSMKTLFLKFRAFEEQHGTHESVEVVKQRALQFVTKADNNASQI